MANFVMDICLSSKQLLTNFSDLSNVTKEFSRIKEPGFRHQHCPLQASGTSQ